MRQGHWRKVLKLKTVAQTIAAVASAIAAVHQLLKKLPGARGRCYNSAPSFHFHYGTPRGKSKPQELALPPGAADGGGQRLAGL